MSKLEDYLSNALHDRFPWIVIEENRRPEWLIDDEGRRLELDFYLPEFAMAVEIQGKQHYEYVEHFHGSIEGFRAQLERDTAKRELCAKHGIALIAITTPRQADKVLDLMDRRLAQEVPKAKDARQRRFLSPRQKSQLIWYAERVLSKDYDAVELRLNHGRLVYTGYKKQKKDTV